MLGAGALIWRFGREPYTAPEVSLEEGIEGRFDRGDNALWMRRHWIHGPGGYGAGEPRDLRRLARELSALGVRRIYPFVGPMDETGWPGWRDEGRIRRYEAERAQRFFAAMSEAAPEVTILPWTGGNLGQDVRLHDEVLRARFAEHAARLVALGAHGIHVNVEPLPDGTEGYLDLLRALREAIGPSAILSVAAYPPTTPLHPFRDIHWSLEYARRVCMIADELAVMSYDTALESTGAYERLVAEWTRDLLATLPTHADGGCELRMGVPTYEDDELYHRPDVETAEHALRGILHALASDDAPRPLEGVAIYASWTTDAAEWATYERLWRGRAPSGATVTEAP